MRDSVGQGFIPDTHKCLGMLWVYVKSLDSEFSSGERESVTTVSFSVTSPHNGEELQGTRHSSACLAANACAPGVSGPSRSSLGPLSQTLSLSAESHSGTPCTQTFLISHSVQGILNALFHIIHRTTLGYWALLCPLYTCKNRGSGRNSNLPNVAQLLSRSGVT